MFISIHHHCLNVWMMKIELHLWWFYNNINTIYTLYMPKKQNFYYFIWSFIKSTKIIIIKITMFLSLSLNLGDFHQHTNQFPNDERMGAKSEWMNEWEWKWIFMNLFFTLLLLSSFELNILCVTASMIIIFRQWWLLFNFIWC